MKFKKLISTVLLSAALVGGGLTHAKTVDAALNKKQAIAIVNNKKAEPTSGQYVFTTKIKSGKQKLGFDAHGTFVTKPQLVQSITTVRAGKNKGKVEQWVDLTSNRLYTKVDGKWQYIPLEDSETAQPDMQKYESTIKKFTKSVKHDFNKNARLSHKKGVYTLKSSVSMTKAAKLLNQIFKDYKVDTKSFKKHVKLSKCYVTFTLKDEEVTDYAVSFKMNYDKKTPASFKLKMFGFGGSDSLALPDEVKNATPDPSYN